MKKLFKRIINRVARAWHMELTYHHLVHRPELELKWLHDLNIRTVLDIGANEGQFARDIAEKIPDAHIISFEPLEDVYKTLIAECPPPRFEAYNFALGDEDEQRMLTRSMFSPSSSLLPILDAHVEAFPHTGQSGLKIVEVRRLDSLELDLTLPLLVKLDVQGYEDRVILGGKETISKAVCVITEVSFENLYGGQARFDDVNKLLKELGFEYHGNIDQLPDPRDGSILQADAIYINRKLRPDTYIYSDTRQ